MRINGCVIAPKANLQGADFQEVDLELANLQGADLTLADLSFANLRFANLQKVDFRGADLRRANLRRANLRGANLREADLRGADLQEADLQGAGLLGADLRLAMITLDQIISPVPDLSGLAKHLADHVKGDRFNQAEWGNECGTACCLAGAAAEFIGLPGNSGAGVLAIKEAMPDFCLDVLFQTIPEIAIAELEKHL